MVIVAHLLLFSHSIFISFAGHADHHALVVAKISLSEFVASKIRNLNVANPVNSPSLQTVGSILQVQGGVYTEGKYDLQVLVDNSIHLRKFDERCIPAVSRVSPCPAVSIRRYGAIPPYRCNVADDEGAGVAPLGFAPDDYLLPAPAGAADDQAAMWAGNGFPFQQGGAAANDMQQAGGYGFQQCTSGAGAGMEGYHLQMAPPDMYGGGGGSSSGGHLQDAYQHYHQQPDAGAMQHGYGFQRAPSSYFAVPSGYQPNPNLGMWSADEPRLAMVSFEYASSDADLTYMDTPAAHSGHGSGGGSFGMGASDNFMNSTPALNLAMGTGGNFISAPPAGPSHDTMNSSGDNFTNATPVQPMPLAMCYGGDLTNGGRYAAQWQQAAPQPHRAGGRRPAQELFLLAWASCSNFVSFFGV